MSRTSHPDDEGSYFLANDMHARTGERQWTVKRRDALSAAGSITVGAHGSNQKKALAQMRKLNRQERTNRNLNGEQFPHSFS